MVGGRIVDNFMDKLAEKISSQDIIRANSQAETAETERIRQEAEQYRIQLDEIKETNREYKEKLDEFKTNLDAVVSRIDDSDTKIHDVGVQIYRNVQAVVEKGDEKTAEEIKEINNRLETVIVSLDHKNSAVVTLLVITLLVALADLIFNILIHLGMI
ncbi:MAG: hypothetical protein K6G10_11940 [Butyrivibrio sp.]|nr:hypothetical protein [Butyrivibrio sp.]